MCFHGRLVFDCNHFAWLGITKPCASEDSFERGETNVGCNKMCSHGLDTIRIQRKCANCIAVRDLDKFKFGVVWDRIAALKDAVAYLRGTETVEEQGQEDEACTTTDPGSDSDSTVLEDTASSCSSWPRTTAGAHESAKREILFDDKHRPLMLPQLVAERMKKKEAEDYCQLPDDANPENAGSS